MKSFTITLIFILMLGVETAYSQVSINKDGSLPDSSAILDINSTELGVLLPRMTKAQIEAISNPANGLIVFNTDDNKLYIYTDYETNWKEVDLGSTVMYPPLRNGSFHDGGIVFYQNGGGGGMVCAASDQSSGAIWGSNGITGATGTSINTGMLNTNKIVSYLGSGSYGAQICNDLVLNSYDDWFLPSKDELHQMYLNKNEINTTAVANGGNNFAPADYLSSSETSSNYNWVHRFSTDGQYLAYKSTLYPLRCVRYFNVTYLIGTGGSCNNTAVNGTYKQGIALGSADTINIDVDVIESGSWNVSTNTVNGYSFSGNGTFTSPGSQTITLYGSGTPLALQTDSFTATADTAGSFTTCSFSVDVDPIIVGDYLLGGIVFYLDGAGNGMICAAMDQSTGAIWGTNSTTGVTATSIGTGSTNTATIVSILGAGSYAAKICDDLSLNTYNDWFLPSKDELHQMYLNKDAINTTAIANGGNSFAASYYWTSSENDYSRSWAHDFAANGQYWTGKGLTKHVRAVRQFSY